MSTEVKVARLPKCNFCDAVAHYDAKTALGPWAYMCGMCFRLMAASTVLGTGLGQRLVLK